ncbi:MFS transporter [Marinicella sp. W31]|uniref:MFS transporter n=1 Tax=Marinicella sp. W31 TaxID=3023713 RepID=UPI00375650C5
MLSFLNRIYAYVFFRDLILIYPLAVVLFTENNMQPWQVGMLLTVWSATTLVLEIPSGVLADKYSRKKILMAGEWCRAFGFLSWILWPNFYGFMLGFMLWGIESALSSGTFQALLYDELKHEKQSQHFTKIIGKTNSLSALAIFFASVGASPAILLGYDFVLWLSITAVFISIACLKGLPDIQRYESTAEEDYFSVLKSGFQLALGQYSIFRIIFFLSLASALPGALEEFWPLFADQAGLPVYLIGIYIGLLCIADAAGSFWAHRFEHHSKSFFYLLLLMNGCILIAAATLFNVPALLLLIVFSVIAKLIMVVYEAKLQHAIPSETRATVSSLSGFMTEAGALIIYLSVGFIAHAFSYQVSFMLYGFLMLVIALLYLTVFTKSSQANK